MTQLLKKLNEPFPEKKSLQHDFYSAVGIGLFVTLFLYFTVPFGLQAYPKNPFWICLGFGGVTIFASLVFEIFGSYVLKLKKDVPSWTLWKWIVSILLLILFISICNYFFIIYLFGTNLLSWDRFYYMLLSTLGVGVFPIVFSGMMIQMNAYKRNQAQAEHLQATLSTSNHASQEITLFAQNNTPPLTLPIAALFYIEAMQNYVCICHLKGEAVTKTIFRNTVKEMENQLAETPLFRCHRSFLVNTNLIEKVAGNAQGLRLTLTGLPDMEVPVSRKYISRLRELVG